MHFKSLAVVVVAALLATGFAADIAEEEDVLVLTDANFDDAIAQYDSLLVEFYAPWCGHCKRLAPEYAKAAATLKKDGLRIAKVDATANSEVAGRFDVSGYPTLKFFRNGKPSDYNGGREENSIVSWVKKKSGPAAKTISTVDEADTFKKSAEVTVFGVFAAEDSAEAKAFLGSAAEIEDVPFAITTSSDIATNFGVSAPAIVLFKDFDEGRADFSGDFTADKVSTFVNENALPIVVPFSQKTANKIFGGSIKQHLLVFAEEGSNGYDDLLKEVSDVAKQFKGKLLTVSVGKGNDRVLSYFGVTKADQPTAAIVNMPEGGAMKKYLLGNSNVNKAELTTFANSFLDGNLKPHLKSEEPPADNSGNVKVVVGKTFAEIALDETKDVLLEFYAPWCGHCKSLAPIYEELAERFKDVKSVVIAKIDATANEVDHPDVNVRGFPTIKFFPAGANPEVIEYEGARDLEGMTAFLKEKAKIPFTLAAADDEHDEL